MPAGSQVILNEARRSLRVKENLPVRWRIQDGYESGEGKVLNISTTGVLLQTRKDFAPMEKTVFALESLGAVNGHFLPKQGRLVWSKTSGFRNNRICGLEFIQPEEKVVANLRERIQSGITKVANARRTRSIFGSLLLSAAVILLGFVIKQSIENYQSLNASHELMSETLDQQIALSRLYQQELAATMRERSLSDRGKKIQLDQQTLEDGFNDLSKNYDARFGGFGQEPKFPMGHSLSFLLRYWKRSKDEKALAMVEHTLKKMAQGGMYDQLGGGFHRYSTDREWQIPHFEKMLYDQAILARVYTEAWQATHDPLYERIVRETLDYVLRDMTDEKGGFYSAEDADSLDPDGGTEKKEGAFYVWRFEELKKNLTADEFNVLKVHFGIEPDGNAKLDPHGEFAGKNVLAATGQADEKTEQTLRSIKKKLFALRLKRPRPHLDDKVLVDWNGLMISSLAFAGRVYQEPRYIAAADKATDFILKHLVNESGRLLHRYRDNDAAILGTVEDYAFFIRGLIDVYEATFNGDYLKRAGELQKEMLRLFWDEKHGGLFFTAEDSEELLFRQKEIYDGAVPSGNSVAALDLIRLDRAELNSEGEAKARGIFQAFAAEIVQRPSAYTQLLIALDFIVGPSSEIVITGKTSDKCREFIDAVYETFLPNKVVLFKVQDTKPAVLICQNRVCLRPVHSAKELRGLLKKDDEKIIH